MISRAQLLGLILPLGILPIASGQIVLTALTYEQDFSGFTSAVTLPEGWSINSSGGVEGYEGAWGSGTAGGLRGDKVIGYQHTASSGIFTITATFHNNLGNTIEQLDLSYLGRVERATQTRFPEWTVSLNGNPLAALAYSTGAGADQVRATSVTGLAIAQNDTFTISWASDRGENATGSSRQIGLGDFQLTAVTAIPEPTTYTMILGLVAMGGVMTRRRYAPSVIA